MLRHTFGSTIGIFVGELFIILWCKYQENKSELLRAQLVIKKYSFYYVHFDVLKLLGK